MVNSCAVTEHIESNLAKLRSVKGMGSRGHSFSMFKYLQKELCFHRCCLVSAVMEANVSGRCSAPVEPPIYSGISLFIKVPTLILALKVFLMYTGLLSF